MFLDRAGYLNFFCCTPMNNSWPYCSAVIVLQGEGTSFYAGVGESRTLWAGLGGGQNFEVVH